MPLNAETLNTGRLAFETYCSVCHGAWGDGQKTLSSQYGASPANLQSTRIRKMPDGRIYQVVSVGKGTMPGYQSLLSEEKRWMVVLYLRSLQRAQNATESDLLEALKGHTVEQPADGRNSGDK